MIYLATICGCLGAWLLVAGPIYQAALELQEQQVDEKLIEAAESTVQTPARISPWWWLIPPVGYLKQRKQAKAHRQAVFDALGPEQLEQTVTFFNKANGWLVVASGAFFIAVKETWDVTELFHWPDWLFWVLLVVFVLVCVGNTTYRTVRTARILARQEKEGTAA